MRAEEIDHGSILGKEATAQGSLEAVHNHITPALEHQTPSVSFTNLERMEKLHPAVSERNHRFEDK
jgi:hypothetical protein